MQQYTHLKTFHRRGSNVISGHIVIISRHQCHVVQQAGANENSKNCRRHRSHIFDRSDATWLSTEEEIHSSVIISLRG